MNGICRVYCPALGFHWHTASVEMEIHQEIDRRASYSYYKGPCSFDIFRRLFVISHKWFTSSAEEKKKKVSRLFDFCRTIGQHIYTTRYERLNIYKTPPSLSSYTVIDKTEETGIRMKMELICIWQHFFFVVFFFFFFFYLISIEFLSWFHSWATI